MMLTQDYIKNLFYYKDGSLYWKNDSWNKKIKDKAAGCAGGYNPYRYMQTRIKGVLYKNHRLIYLYHYGVMPPLIDHINGNTLDNRIENLRAATVHENGYNSKIASNNTSGSKGVVWSKKSNKWFVRVSHNKKRITVGYFEDLSDAQSAAQNAREKFNGEFARHV